MSNHKDHPDEDIGDDPRRQIMSMHRHCSIPEESRNCPRIGTGKYWKMDEGRGPQVSPVGSRQAEHLGYEDDLRRPEVVAHPQHDESKDKQIVQDEVTGHIGRGRDEGGVPGEKVPDIADLREQQQDPAAC